jgi:hypothetical protein
MGPESLSPPHGREYVTATTGVEHASGVPRCQWHAPIEAEERDSGSRGIFLAVSKSASVTGVVTTNVNGDYRCYGQRLGNVGPTFGCTMDGASMACAGSPQCRP